MQLGARISARWKRRRPTFPWTTAVVGAAILSASASSSSVREHIANFAAAWLILIAGGFFAALIVPGLLAYVVKTDSDPEDAIDAVRVAQVAIIVLVIALWGSTPSPLPADPGDRSPF